MKKKNKIFIFLVLFSWGVTGLLVWWYLIKEPICHYSVSKKECPEVLLTIEKGDGVAVIAAKLKENDLIRNELAFKILALGKNFARRFQAGDFYLSQSDSLSEIARALTKGTADKKITLIEGWRSEEIGEFLLSQGINLELKKWQNLISQKELEGYLFPDTYMIPKTATLEKIVEILIKNFNNKFNDELEKAALTKGIDKQSVLILASIVEREARHEEDRPIIAGILLKRLASNWPLQVDATIQYAVASAKCKSYFDVLAKGGRVAKCDWWPKKISQSDLKIDSLYNTYLNRGLPPGPICNPSLSAIKSVIYSQDSPYWYYLSDSSGQTHYAENNDQHAQNVSKFLWR